MTLSPIENDRCVAGKTVQAVVLTRETVPIGFVSPFVMPVPFARLEPADTGISSVVGDAAVSGRYLLLHDAQSGLESKVGVLTQDLLSR